MAWSSLELSEISANFQSFKVSSSAPLLVPALCVWSESVIRWIYHTHNPLASSGEYLNVWESQGRETPNTAEPSLLLLTQLLTLLLSCPLTSSPPPQGLSLWWATKLSSRKSCPPRTFSILTPAIQSMLKHNSFLRRNFDTSY